MRGQFMSWGWPAIFLFAASAHAQLSITAEVNKTQVALDDQVVLAVTITGPQASLPDPQLPALQNFSAYSSGRNQSISFVNGRVTSSVTHTFVLIPRAVGKGIIPPIGVSAQGASAQTEPIEIQVSRPGASAAAPQPPAASRSGPPQAAPAVAGAPDFFVTSELDKKKAYVNEQVTLSVKFYTAVSLNSNPEYEPPKLEGFLIEDLPPLRHYNAVVKGRTYYVTEIKSALFPLQAGRMNIGAAVVRCAVQQALNADPFSPDFFDRFFAQGFAAPRTKTLSSQRLSLEVAPLPAAGKPQNFSGAVGKFSISAALDKTRSKVGEAVNLTITVQGAGNLKAIGDPSLPPLPSWRVFDPVSSVNQEKKADLVQGSRVIRTVLVPRVSGDLVIGPIVFSYFDPRSGTYVSAETKPGFVTVTPGDANAAPAVGFTAPAAPAARGLTRINEDIAYIKVRPGAAIFTRVLEAVADAGPAHAPPFLFFAWTLAFSLYRGRLAADPKGARFRGAWKAAMRRLRAARRASDEAAAAGLLTEALCGYLADKLAEPASGLTMRRVQELLRLRQPHVAEESIDRIRSLWEELDSRRFAPPGAGGAGLPPSLSEETISLLQLLEREFKR